MPGPAPGGDSLRLNGGASAFVPRTPYPQHTHLEYGYHIRVGVEQEGGEFRVGAWPGQHSHHKARCHLERAKRGCGHCRVRRYTRATGSPHTGPQAHLHFLTAQAQLAGSLLKKGHSSPWGHRESWGCSCLASLPWPRRSLGAPPEMDTDPERSCFLLNTIPHPSETPLLLSPGKIFWASQ